MTFVETFCFKPCVNKKFLPLKKTKALGPEKLFLESKISPTAIWVTRKARDLTMLAVLFARCAKVNSTLGHTTPLTSPSRCQRGRCPTEIKIKLTKEGSRTKRDSQPELCEPPSLSGIRARDRPRKPGFGLITVGVDRGEHLEAIVINRDSYVQNRASPCWLTKASNWGTCSSPKSRSLNYRGRF